MMKSTIVFSVGLSSAVFLFDLNEMKLGDRSVCPGSFSPVHGSCDLGATFTNSCDEVKEEIEARSQGLSGWQDPHNGGKYTFLGDKDGVTQTKRLTGDKLFIDHINFGYKSTADGGCYVAACSDSSGISAPDGQVGFCNVRNLYCNSNDGCQVVKNELNLASKPTLGFCPNANDSKCGTTKNQFFDLVGAPAQWSDCGTVAGKVNGVVFTPDPPVKGNDNLISGNGVATAAFTSGKASITIKLNGLQIAAHSFDACAPSSFNLPLGAGTLSYGGIKCPVAAGENINVDVHAKLSRTSPGGSLETTVEAKNQDGNKAMCVKTDFKL